MDEPYCETPAPAPVAADGNLRSPRGDQPLDSNGQLPLAHGHHGTGAFAECVLCRKPTEYPESVKGATLCPVCEWQEAQRTACSG
jgi:hypothetical protein